MNNFESTEAIDERVLVPVDHPASRTLLIRPRDPVVWLLGAGRNDGAKRARLLTKAR